MALTKEEWGQWDETAASLPSLLSQGLRFLVGGHYGVECVTHSGTQPEALCFDFLPFPVLTSQSSIYSSCEYEEHVNIFFVILVPTVCLRVCFWGNLMMDITCQ